LKYKIEVRIPCTLEWVSIETGVMALQQIRKQVAMIKRIYPEYVVRALNLLNSKTLVVA
jgi:hypothetical protein